TATSSPGRTPLPRALSARCWSRNCPDRRRSQGMPTPSVGRDPIRSGDLDMRTPDTKAAQPAGRPDPIGKAALVASVGGMRGYADWANPDHRLRRLVAEFIGTAGLTFILSGGAAILARYGGRGLQPWQTGLVLSLFSALWFLVAIYFLGDISAHFNPA